MSDTIALTVLQKWLQKLGKDYSIAQLRALTDLCLNIKQLTSLPSEIGRCTALANLYLNSTQLTSLPSEIGRLSISLFTK